MLKDVIGHDDLRSTLFKIKEYPPKVMLFVGPSGVGKKFTAKHFIDEIHNGYFNHSEFVHPDIFILEPEKNTFKLELVNTIKESISTTPFSLNKKFYILDKVDLMNKESSNACLKMFEDCPKYASFILLAENIDNVLDTIKSRSIIFKFNPLEPKIIKDNFPNISDIQLTLIRGCIGKLDELKKIDLDKIKKKIHSFVASFNKKNYSEIIEWCSFDKETNIDLFNDILIMECLKHIHCQQNKLPIEILLEESIKFKDKIKLNLNLRNHFSNMLIQARNKLAKIN